MRARLVAAIRDFRRYSALRQAFLFVFVFLAGLTAAGILIHGSVTGELTEAVDDRLEQRWQTLAAHLVEDGFKEMDEIVPATIRTGNTHTLEVSQFNTLFDQTGGRIAGDAVKFPSGSGYALFSARKLGIPDDDVFRILGKPLGEMTLVVGETLDPIEDTSETLLTAFAWGGGFITFFTLLTGFVLGRSMQVRIADIHRTLEAFANGRFDARVGGPPARDDIGHIAQSVDHVLARLQASIGAMSDMSANIAHDLKTPISRLQTLAAQTRDPTRSSHARDESLARIEAEADTIAKTFDALLRISQINAGSRRERFEDFQAGEIMDSIFEVYSAVAEDAGRTLILDEIHDAGTQVHGDRALLFQVLANLVENALEHTPPATEIALSVKTSGNMISLVVSDNGPGVPASDLQRIVEPHFRAEKSRSTKGSGLGLALVDSIVKLHEGSIEIENTDPGLRVTIRLPVAAS